MTRKDTAASPTALIADDEPLLAQALQSSLRNAWPELQILDTVGSGPAALSHIRSHTPDIAFLDIRMPGATGLEVARIITEDWDDDSSEPPLIVFVTAYDEHAVEAFENAAIDYLLKPVTDARLARCVERLQERLTKPEKVSRIDALAEQMRALLQEQSPSARKPTKALRTINASVGTKVQMIPVQSVLMFEAADKYVIVHHTDGDALIRESLRELAAKLDDEQFKRIHRGTIVNIDAVQAAERQNNGKLRLVLRNSELRPVVSRLYTSLFKAM